MKSASTYKLVSLSTVAFALLALGSAHQGPSIKGKIPYAKVAPLIKTECMYCHNANQHPEKTDLSSYQALMKSGEHGPIVIAGHPEKSKLIMYIDGQKQPSMPFKKPPMSKVKIQMLKDWIAAGAKS